MPLPWSGAAGQEFWSHRSVNFVLKQNIPTTMSEDDTAARANRDEEQRLQFNSAYAHLLSTQATGNSHRDITIPNDLQF